MKTLPLLLISSLAIGPLGCQFIPRSNITYLSDIPTIAAFYAYPTKTTGARPVIISWDVTNATSIQIDQGVGSGLDASGGILVSPNSSTTYTLTASNSAGTVTRSITVTVVALPDIVIFDISPNILHWSKESVETAVMRWEVRNATIVKITERYLVMGREQSEDIDSGRPLQHIGSRIIQLSPEPIAILADNKIQSIYLKPLGTRTYTLEATNDNGTVTKIQTLEAVP